MTDEDPNAVGVAPTDGDPNATTGPQRDPNDVGALPTPDGNNDTGNGSSSGSGSGNGNDAVDVPGTPRFIGRVDAAAPVLSWSGTGVEATFRGTGGSATFTVRSGTNYLGVSLDGAAPTRVQVDGKKPLTFGPVAAGKHTVRFTKLNEAELGVLGFTDLSVDGNVLATAVPARRLEFVGGSLTLGYGVEGTDPCSNSAAMENVLKAFSGQVAGALGADASVVAWSGHGLLRNGIGISGGTMPELYGRTVATDDKAVYTFPAAQTPQAIVCNFGTNDFAYQNSSGRAMLDQNAFRDAYVSFVTTLRQKNPGAVVVLTNSPMLYDSTAERQHTSLGKILLAVQSSLGDANVRVVDVPIQSGANGCNSHPSAATQAAMAALVVKELKATLGW